MANRRKHTNAVPAAAFAKWFVLAFFAAVLGLCFVYLKNQMHATGAEITRLEKELDSLSVQNEHASGKVALLSSRTALQRCLKDGFIKMVPISDNRIVRLNSGGNRFASNELRAVANRGVAK